MGRLAGFLSDLLAERRDFLGRISSTADESVSSEDLKNQRDEDEEKRRQYLRVDLETLLIEAGCCRHLERLTTHVASTGGGSSTPVKPTVDDVDKIVTPVETFVKLSACELRRSRRMKNSLTLLRLDLDPLVAEEEREEGVDGDRTLRDLVVRIDAIVSVIVADKTEL